MSESDIIDDFFELKPEKYGFLELTTPWWALRYAFECVYCGKIIRSASRLDAEAFMSLHEVKEHE